MERMTIQRTMILKAISSLGHASIKEIDEFLNKNSHKLPLTTIYRNINVLLNGGKIEYINQVKSLEKLLVALNVKVVSNKDGFKLKSR